jgi:hypothetical protein
MPRAVAGIDVEGTGDWCHQQEGNDFGRSFMNILLGIIAIAATYLLVGVAVAKLYVAPWLERLSPDTIRKILHGVEGLELDTMQDLEIARRAYTVSIIPVWPVYAYRVATYGHRITES